MTRWDGVRVAAFCLLGGLCFALTALSTGHVEWSLLSGLLMTAVLAPVACCGPRGLLSQFGAIALVLIVVGLVCTMSEALLFFPEMKATLATSLVGGSVFYLVVTAVLVLAAKVLKLSDASERKVEHRSAAIAVLMVLLCGVAYLVYYEIFGAIAFQLFTKQYYPHAVDQVMAMGVWFPLYQIARGLLMTLAVLPIIYTLRMKRWQAALVVGILVWVVGGAAPLLVPNGTMVAAQRYLHIVEIMTQNVSLGATAVFLLRPRAAKAAASVQAVPAA
jgi:hypothetical protein